VGKVASSLLLAAIQFALLFGVGGTLLGLHVRGSWLEVIAVAVAFSLFLVATGLAITAVCRSVMQANAFAYVGMVLFSCLAGALVPESTLPSWAKVISPAVPSYWAMRGYRDAILGRAPIILPVVVLLGFAISLTLLATLRLRFDERKIGFS
jgi:ABC-2 type transport system permease protein